MKQEKITWKRIFQDFKENNPTLAKSVIYWRPYNFATIEIWFDNKTKKTYNYDTKKLKVLKQESV